MLYGYYFSEEKASNKVVALMNSITKFRFVISFYLNFIKSKYDIPFHKQRMKNWSKLGNILLMRVVVSPDEVV